MQNKNTSKLILPNNENKLLLHSCCAPCSGNILERLIDSQIETTIYYFNPNIFPEDEYLKRKDENKRFAEKLGIPFVDADYDQNVWFSFIEGFEDEPERGKRCSKCFDLRMQRTAEFAFENGFLIFATTLGISRWKDLDQVNKSGHAAAEPFEDIIFWDFNWRKEGGSIKMYDTAKREEFYSQTYCGCKFSRKNKNETL